MGKTFSGYSHGTLYIQYLAGRNANSQSDWRSFPFVLCIWTYMYLYLSTADAFITHLHIDHILNTMSNVKGPRSEVKYVITQNVLSKFSTRRWPMLSVFCDQMGREALEGLCVSPKPAATRKINKRIISHPVNGIWEHGEEPGLNKWASVHTYLRTRIAKVSQNQA